MNIPQYNIPHNNNNTTAQQNRNTITAQHITAHPNTAQQPQHHTTPLYNLHQPAHNIIYYNTTHLNTKPHLNTTTLQSRTPKEPQHNGPHLNTSQRHHDLHNTAPIYTSRCNTTQRTTSTSHNNHTTTKTHHTTTQHHTLQSNATPSLTQDKYTRFFLPYVDWIVVPIIVLPRLAWSSSCVVLSCLALSVLCCSSSSRVLFSLP
jgi:hypothetical protein